MTTSLVLGLFGDRRAAGSRGLIENCHELGTLTRSLSALHLVAYTNSAGLLAPGPARKNRNSER